jgi:uncharacterized membrane protein
MTSQSKSLVVIALLASMFAANIVFEFWKNLGLNYGIALVAAVAFFAFVDKKVLEALLIGRKG